MEFSVFCPCDGRVEVGLEHIANVILQDAECVDILFVCPVCGEQIRIQLRIPNLLVTAMELVELAEGRETTDRFVMMRGSADEATGVSDDTVADMLEPVSTCGGDERRIEDYCEYFRRQLASADSVDAMLAEMDG